MWVLCVKIGRAKCLTKGNIDLPPWGDAQTTEVSVVRGFENQARTETQKLFSVGFICGDSATELGGRGRFDTPFSCLTGLLDLNLIRVQVGRKLFPSGTRTQQSVTSPAGAKR